MSLLKPFLKFKKAISYALVRHQKNPSKTKPKKTKQTKSLKQDIPSKENRLVISISLALQEGSATVLFWVNLCYEEQDEGKQKKQ